jgi:FlaA1/EpsC-like NDP-sugar epimerase
MIPFTKPVASHESVHDRVVMVTGAGGSIGSQLVQHIAASRPAKLILVDHSELNLYEVGCALEESRLRVETKNLIMDVRDQQTLRHVFVKQDPEIVFHAAALKHVPLLENEHNLVEAVRTNVLGSKNVADLCSSHGASMVMISTDKAVNPSSVMGLTKRVAEIYVHGKALRHPYSSFLQVRFGNVFGSSGSAVPKFKKQIAKGGPVTVTHPEMTRYLMSINDAVDLTLSAADLHGVGNGFGLYILDMGQPVKIVDLARSLIEQAGLRPGVDIPIEFIGIRPGEKLHEELRYYWETSEPTCIEGVTRSRPMFEPNGRLKLIEALLHYAAAHDGPQVKHLLTQIVPEYSGADVWA